MSPEEMKTLYRDAVEEAFKGNRAAFDEMVHPDYYYRTDAGDKDRDTKWEFIELWRTAFPDLQATIDDQIVDGDKCATRYRLKGTHTGHFGEHSPTNRKFDIRTIDIVRFKDGKLFEAWEEMDQLRMMQQLGLAD